MQNRRTLLLSIVGFGLAISGCATNTPAPAYSGPTKTIRGYLQGPPYARLTASTVVFITAYDATNGATGSMPKIGATSFTLNRNGYFPVAYEIEIPASHAAPRISLAVEMRQYGRVTFTNDRQYSQTTGRNLDIPVREAPPRVKSRNYL
ncbi:hypothetical protein [Phyllobacterium sp. YR531]|uniref:hypothetical protein n=1 Tax=Phyllobacterium sp. YR531 TaxID=1144343 RepID=UPI00026F5289|nr:hypothetical protein [Phyllobacterium sp. YR531]EJN03127.1 hypothetical protein PMI41_02674 [Phyllobacterium sp. YR531]